MPGNLQPGQMFDNELNPRKGWPSPYALDKACPVYDEGDADEPQVRAGMVVHIDPDTNKFRAGLWEDANCNQEPVALFAFQNWDDFDVNSDVGNISGGNLMALCALGDFELETTEFTASPTTGAGTYASGVYLTTDDAAQTNAGILYPGTLGSDAIVGICSDNGTNSDGSFSDENGIDKIRFWSCWYPSGLRSDEEASSAGA